MDNRRNIKTVEAISKTIVSETQSGTEGVTEADLKRHGFTQADIDAHGDDARAAAQRRLNRTYTKDAPGTAPKNARGDLAGRPDRDTRPGA